MHTTIKRNNVINNITKWKRFKKNKSAFYSLITVSIIFIISIFSEVICNNKPIIILYKKHIMFPIFLYYSEKDFDGEFDMEPDYNNKEVIDNINKNGFCIFPIIKYSYNTINTNLTSSPPSAPTIENILGTDDYGRDLFARLLYGIRVSLLFSIILSSISMVLGIIIGSIQGYFSGIVDTILQRIIEIWIGIPIMFVFILFSTLVTPTFTYLIIVMSCFSWIYIANIVRIEFLRARNFTYVKAAESIGISKISIIFKHILPNVIISSISQFTFLINYSITILTSLSFLGFGLPIDYPSLGDILSQAKDNLYAPWIWITGVLSLSIILILITFIGDGIKDSFNKHVT